MTQRRGGALRRPLTRLEDRAVPTTAPLTVPRGDDPGVDPAAEVTTQSPPINPVAYAVAADVGYGPRVSVFTSAGALKYDFNAYETGFRGGVRVAVGDLTGDGVADVIAAPGPGRAPLVKVFDGASGLETLSFWAYDPNFRGGMFVAVGDVNGDGRLDLITGAGEGGGPHVKVFDGRGLFPKTGDVTAGALPGPDSFVLRSFFAYDPMFIGGVRVAAGDVNGDGRADIVTAAGPGGGPHVVVWDALGDRAHHDMFVADAAFTGGVFVAAGDLDGDGRADFVAGLGRFGNTLVTAYSGGTGRMLKTYRANDRLPTASVRVAVADVNGDGTADLITSVSSRWEVRDGVSFSLLAGLNAFNPAYTGDIFVG